MKGKGHAIKTLSIIIINPLNCAAITKYENENYFDCFDYDYDDDDGTSVSQLITAIREPSSLRVSANNGTFPRDVLMFSVDTIFIKRYIVIRAGQMAFVALALARVAIRSLYLDGALSAFFECMSVAVRTKATRLMRISLNLCTEPSWYEYKCRGFIHRLEFLSDCN